MRKFAVYKNSARRTGRSFRHLNYSKSIIYISFPVRYFRKTSEESSVRNREDIIALNRRRLSFASSQNFIFSLSVGAMLRTSQRAPSPMLKLVVIFRVARKFDCTVFVRRTTPLFCLILRWLSFRKSRVPICPKKWPAKMPAQTGSYSTDSFLFPPNYFFMYRTIDFCSAKSFLAHRNHVLYFKIAHIKNFL